MFTMSWVCSPDIPWLNNWEISVDFIVKKQNESLIILVDRLALTKPFSTKSVTIFSSSRIITWTAINSGHRTYFTSKDKLRRFLIISTI